MREVRTVPVVTNLVAVVVLIIAATDWMLEPERALLWLLAIVAMGAIWLISTAANQRSADDEGRKRNIVQSAALAGVLLGAALVMPLLQTDSNRDEMHLRAWGVMSGFILMFVANRIPKLVRSTASMRSPAAFLAAKRFNGWLFVFAGLASILLWIFVPISLALTLSMAVIALAFALVLGRRLMAFRQTAG